jgi:hypothetical protein
MGSGKPAHLGEGKIYSTVCIRNSWEEDCPNNDDTAHSHIALADYEKATVGIRKATVGIQKVKVGI